MRPKLEKPEADGETIRTWAVYCKPVDGPPNRWTNLELPSLEPVGVRPADTSAHSALEDTQVLYTAGEELCEQDKVSEGGQQRQRQHRRGAGQRRTDDVRPHTQAYTSMCARIHNDGVPGP